MSQTNIGTQVLNEFACHNEAYDPEQLLTVAQAGALLSVKPKTLYAWAHRDQVPHRKVCSLVRFHRGELIEWTRNQS
jgi:excisionase family DNA binding protein